MQPRREQPRASLSNAHANWAALAILIAMVVSACALSNDDGAHRRDPNVDHASESPRAGELSRSQRAAFIAAEQAAAPPTYDFEPRGLAHCATMGLAVAVRDGEALFHPDGGDVSTSGAWSLSMRLSRWGRTASMIEAETTPTSVRDNRATTVRRDGLEEWHLNGPLGVEHGFTLNERPAGAGELVFEIETSGLELAPGGDDEAIFRGAGGTRLRYTDLYAYDADERVLAARMDVRDETIVIHVDDRGARYPLVVDPLLWIEQQILTASDAASFDEFGRAVAVDGDTIVVGSRLDDHSGLTNAGAAYVFVRNGDTWTEQQKLIASDAADDDEFGAAVAIDGDTVIVGATQDDHAGGSNAGSAYVFVRSGMSWTEQQKLMASDPGDNDEFGFAVRVDGDTFVAGAPYHDDPGGNTGAAYVFVRAAGVWSEEQELAAAGSPCCSQLGGSVDIDGDTVIVGAQVADAGGGDSGAAYVFVRNTGVWTQEQRLLSTDLAAGDRFGAGVAVLGDTAVVGAWGDNPAGNNAGAAYFFGRAAGVWTQQQKVIASDASADGRFGNSVDLDVDTALIGAQNNGAGEAYVFRLTGTWSEHQILRPPAIWPAVRVGLSGDIAIVSAHGADPSGMTDAGAAYVYALVGGPCSVPGDCGSGYCVDNFCCDTPCDGGCGACDLVGDEGTCSPLVSGDVGDPSCNPYLCDGANVDCPLSCGVDADCATGFGCDSGACVALKANGVACGADGDGDGECSSAMCTDGVCCDSLCGSPCDACDVAGNLGTCTAVASGSPGSPSCAPYLCDGASVACPSSCTTFADCSGDHYCSGGLCVPDEPIGVACTDAGECQSGECVDGYCCNTACDGPCDTCLTAGEEGTCAPLPKGSLGTPACSPYLCDGAAAVCPESCTFDVDCDPESHCDNGVCLGNGVDGEDCEESVECASGNCVSGVCCDTQCDEDCAACDLPESLGTCSPLAQGTPSTCAPFVCTGEALDCPATCTDDAACPAGTLCEDGSCVEDAGLACDGDHTLVDTDGSEVDCSPYRCTDANTCRNFCASTADCAGSSTCNASGECAAPPSDESDDEGGCSCRIPTRTPSGSWASWLLIAAALAAARRRRRRRE